MIIETRAFARAGLLGNPSDGYFGKTISISVRNFGAQVTLYESPELVIEPQPSDVNVFKDIHDLVDRIESHGYYGGDRLVKAAIKQFYQYCRAQGIQLPLKNFTIRYRTNIPRQVGLAGSSAIVTATFRALIQFFHVEIPKPLLPTLILKTETDELGINAGLQDRVIQVYEGCVYMDFDRKFMEKHGHGKYEPLEASKLKNIYLAYRTDLSKVSGQVLNDIRQRYEKGDQQVIETLEEIASLAEQGKTLIEKGELEALNELINRNFDLRRKIMRISDENLKMIETARRCGASAKFAGSGGAIVGFYRDDAMLSQLIEALKPLKARVIKPFII